MGDWMDNVLGSPPGIKMDIRWLPVASGEGLAFLVPDIRGHEYQRYLGLSLVQYLLYIVDLTIMKTLLHTNILMNVE